MHTMSEIRKTRREKLVAPRALLLMAAAAFAAVSPDAAGQSHGAGGAAQHESTAGLAAESETAAPGGAASEPPVIPPVTPEDREAAFPNLSGSDMRHMMLEDPFNTFLLFDRLEAREADRGSLQGWDLSGWVGHALRRVWIRSEGERRSGSTEEADLEVLWGRSVTRWWDVVAGGRQEFEPGPAQTWAAFGVQGLAPYRFELDATAYVGEAGRTAGRLAAEYELLITNRLILQPRIELNWYGRSDLERAIGSGLSTGEAGLRLRYEIRREIAPYVGVMKEKKFGRTADLFRAAGDDPSETRFVAGIRLWF